MSERNLDFDTIVNRKNTNCLKYDFAKKRGMPEDVLPLWVADMDFKTSSYIQDAIIAQAQHGIYGYSELQEPYFEVLSNWCKVHYDLELDPHWLIKTPGVVFALAMAVKAFTEVDEAVMIQMPVYYPFREVIEDNHRKLIDNTLVLGEDGKYHIDFADFENKLQKENVKLFFLCNPHNPVGRVWTREELVQIAELCLKYGVIIISDEIHADFVWKGKHQSFLNLDEKYKDIVITCMAPSKTFNIAGLQLSNIFIPNRELKYKFRKEVDAAGYSQLNAAGLIAADAAYRYGEEWYQAMKKYVAENIAFTAEFVEKNLPGVTMIQPEGTYLVWLDFRGTNLCVQEIEDLIIRKAGLWLDSGKIFGVAGEGFQRINVACPRVTLTEALERIQKALK